MLDTRKKTKLRNPLATFVPEAKKQDKEYFSRVIVRLAALALAVTLCAGLVLSVHIRLWDAGSPVGHLVYQLHDTIFLAIKGQIFVRNFPLSMTLLTVVTILVLILLCFYVVERAPLKAVHFRTLQWLLEVPARHPIALSSANLTRRLLRISPHLTRAIVLQQWESEIVQLSKVEPKTLSLNGFRKILAYSELLGKLTSYFNSPREQLRQIEQIHFLHVFTSSLVLPDHQTSLQDELIELWKRAYRDRPDNVKKAIPTYLNHDLLLAVDLLFNPLVPSTLVDLAQQCESCIIQLVNLVAHPTSPMTWRRNELDLLAVLARISMNLTIHVASLTADYRLAVDYWDLIEMAQFSLDVSDGSRTASKLEFLRDLLTDNNVTLQQMCMRHIIKTLSFQHALSNTDARFVSESADKVIDFELMVVEYWAPSVGSVPYTAQDSK